MNTHTHVALAGTLVAFLSGCATAPAPMATMMVPSVGHDRELQKFSTQPGTVTELMTVEGQEKWLVLDHSDGSGFVGHAYAPFASSEAQQDAAVETVPFDQVALVYYAVPPHPFKSNVEAEKSTFPSLHTPGTMEQGASCEQLDVDLARSEAIRWYARDQGAIPFTSAQAVKTHAKNAAEYTAITALVVVALAAGAGGGGGSWDFGSWTPGVLSNEDWRWVVTAADRRTLGLLQLKETKHCATRAVAGVEGGDLGILAAIEDIRHAPRGERNDDVARLAQETTWLDKLNPAPLRPRDEPSPIRPRDEAGPIIIDYGEGATERFDKATWVPDTGSFLSMASAGTLYGTLVMTEQSLIFQPKSQEYAAADPRLRIAFTDIASVEVRHKMSARWVVVTRQNGHRDTFWLTHGITMDRERMDAVAAMLQGKIPPKSADRASL